MLSSDLKRVALRILKALDVDEARVISDHIKHNRWDEVVMTKFNPLHYQHLSVDQFRRVYLAQEFLRKADFLDTTFDKAAVARSGFLACESQCFHANRHLDQFLTQPVLDTAVKRSFYEIVLKAKTFIQRTLGSIPTTLNGKFGPGAVYESEVWRHRKTMTHYDKLRNTPCASHKVSEAMVDHLVWSTAFSFAWADACPNRLLPRVNGNRFTTVPKDATKDRGIAIEPSLNVLGQLAVGGHIKTRLKRVGLDLRGVDEDLRANEIRMNPNFARFGLSWDRPWKGQQLHREMACEASKTGSHSTIDLSNASDTICLNLVKLLLPDVWYDLLFELRSPMTRFSPTGEKKDQRWYLLEKFSSMGNGFTFELETLIFAALAHAVGANVGVDTFVYGDDIIIPTEFSADLLAVLRYSGLTPNGTKTFTTGAFRESCGGDFFFGHDVRPFYIKESPSAAEDWITIANNLRYWSIKWTMPELMAVRASVLDNIPADIAKCRGPEELGDLVIHDDERYWNTTIRGSIRYVRVWRPVHFKKFLFSRAHKASVEYLLYQTDGLTLTEKAKVRLFRDFTEQGVALTAALIGLPSDGLSPRNSVDGYRFGRIAYS